MKSPFLRLFIAVCLLPLLFCQGCLQGNKPACKNLLKQIPDEFTTAGSQYKLMQKELTPGRFPRNYDPAAKKFETSDAGWWCSGFYPGTLLYLWEETKDQQIWDESQRILGELKSQQFNTSTHDLGFMMYCSFGNLQRLQPSDSTKEVLIQSARSLSTRFNPNVGCIKSWDSPDSSEFLVIIDNMMNLELLFYATRVTGDSSFYNIAVTHANTTMKHHFRDNNSSYHVVNYNKNTGEVLGRRTAQGYADSSAWSRGQAWGLYGYTMTYRETKDRRYLDMADKIATFMLNHPDLPDDYIPYWDYNAPDIPNARRDASAGAIMAAGLLELCKYVDEDRSKKYFSAAERVLKSLSGTNYKAAPGTNGGFILMHSVGHLPAKSEVDVAISYADYYYIEALKRYKEHTQGVAP